MYEYIEAEESLVSCLMTRGDAVEDIYGLLTPDMFESGILGCMYIEYTKAFDEKRELTLEELHQRTAAAGFEDYEITDAIKRCAMRSAMSFQIKSYAAVIQNHFKKKQIDRILGSIEIKDGDVDNQIDTLIASLEGLRAGESSDAETIAQITERYKDSYFIERDRPIAKLNIEDIDNMVGGFEGGDLVLIGARPAVGKSALATQWSEYFAKQGLKVGYYNLEMTSKQMLERFLAAKSGIELTRIRMAIKFLNDEEERYKRAVDELEKQDHLYISTGAKKVSDIRADVRKMAYDIIVVDYLQLLQADERYSGNRTSEVGEISRQLKAIAIDFNIPVIALSQLNRASESRQDREPNMGELREAGNLEQDASVIILMWDKNIEDRSQKGLKVEKSRQGRTGRCDMIFDGAHVRFIPESQQTPFD